MSTIGTVQINRISRIQGYRIFRDFTWPSDLHEFGRFNLIYGWNGTGKTALAHIFNLLAKQTNITEGIVDLLINGTTVSGETFASASGLPQVRVFNREYIDATVFTQDAPLGPIYYFGEESVAKKKDLDALKVDLTHADSALLSAIREQQNAKIIDDEFCIQNARTIKELLTAPGGGTYNNYNKTDFRNKCVDLVNKDSAGKLLSDSKKARLKLQKEAQPKLVIEKLTYTYPDLSKEIKTVESLLHITVVSKVIEELAAAAAIATWVKQGLQMHKDRPADMICLFCGNPVSPQRLADIEAHFNDQYENFLREIDSKRAMLEAAEKSVKNIAIPDPARLYEHLHDSYAEVKEALKESQTALSDYLLALAAALSAKRDKPFEQMRLESFVAGKKASSDETATKNQNLLNEIIEKHNTHTTDFQRTIIEAQSKLEECLIVETLPEFSSNSDAVQKASRDVKELDRTSKQIKEKIAELERTIVEYRTPAEELDAELRSFLGHGDLTLVIRENGYTIIRQGMPAANLSEGEKSAIAFLYFLKSLQDRTFVLPQGVIMIDDPVSSLDANALFSAFGYMKERTKNAGQLFILTHNFGFFSQVKNWFHHLKGQKSNDISKRPARFYMLATEQKAIGRSAEIKQLDNLLEEFESEYHYLFKKVYEEAQRKTSPTNLAALYALPNLARRLLESFLAFRYPSLSGEGTLMKKLERVPFDESKKVRILRFLHTLSHYDSISEPGNDLSFLSEAPQVLTELFELIKSEDRQHYTEMIEIIKQSSGVIP